MTFKEPQNEADFEENIVRELKDNECPRHTAIGIEVEGISESSGLRRLHLFTPEEKERLKCTCDKEKKL